MEEKRIILEKYIKTAIEKLKKANIYVNEKKAYSLIDKYASEKYSLEEAMQEIDKMIEEILEQYKKTQELREEYLNKIEANKELENLPLEYSGITINPQDVDLMNIESAKTPEELKKAINDANNIRLNIEEKLTDKELKQVKSDTYKLYQLTLVDRNEYIKDKNISAEKKIKYLKDSGKLSEKDEEKLDEIIKSSTSTVEKKERLEKEFTKETAHEIYETIHECDPIEKSGIKKTTEAATNNLIDKINNDYNSITIDNAAKYGAVTLGDGTFNYRDLDKCLDFAKGLDKEVRLNALIFYMDCPKELYDLPKTEENRVIVKEKLTSYVDSITTHINENYSDTVRSIDVINEVLNRHPMDGEIKYQYRGDIDQTNANDDTISGWLKHLDMKDLCDVVAVARNNLPETDFMYNDDYLTDPDKLEATKDIMKQIKDYEQEHDIKIVDSIGTQMHLDNDVTIEQIENMFRELAIYGLPIEITEFDLAMTQNVEEKTSEEIEVLRQQKINEIYNCIENLKQEGINIRGCTIWSKTDSQNFRVTLANEERIANGQKPIDTLHGGYFTENMESKSNKLVNRTDKNIHAIEEMMDKGKTPDEIAILFRNKAEVISNPEKQIERISNNKKYSEEEKKKELEKFKKQIKSPAYQDITKKNKKSFINTAESIEKAIEAGKTSKEEVTDYVRKDLGNNNKPKQENKPNKEINSMIVPPKQSPIQIEKPKVMVKQQPQNKNTNNSNKGSVGILVLGVIITIVGIIIMILSKLLTM